ncbi:diguanylate cyclase domain-containing protein [Halomonadaceae bacterium KBTZ08]
MSYYKRLMSLDRVAVNGLGGMEPLRPSIEEMLFAERERARVTLDSIGDAVISTNVAGRITYMNVVAERMTGWLFSEVRGQPFTRVFKVIDAATREPASNPAEEAVRDDCTVELAANSLLIQRNGGEVAIEDTAAPIHDRWGRVSGAVIVFHDVRFSQAVTDRMAYLANHDALTGLPNRTALAENFDHAVALAGRHGRQAALLFVDLDNFKDVNDTLGHEAGDALLIKLGYILTRCVRETDTVCRYGGDEFVLLLSEVECVESPEAVAAKVRQAVSECGLLDGYTGTLTLSIGISIYPDDGLTMGTLLHQADQSMYKRKGSMREEDAYRTQVQLARTRSLKSAPRRAWGWRE